MKKKLIMLLVFCVISSLLFTKPPALPNVALTCYMNSGLQLMYNMSLVTDMLLGDKALLKNSIKILNKYKKDNNSKTIENVFFAQYLSVIQEMAINSLNRQEVSEDALGSLGSFGCKRAEQGYGAMQDALEILIRPIVDLLPEDVKKMFLFKYKNKMSCKLKNSEDYDIVYDSAGNKFETTIVLQIVGDSLEALLKDYFKDELLTEGNEQELSDNLKKNQFDLLTAEEKEKKHFNNLGKKEKENFDINDKETKKKIKTYIERDFGKFCKKKVAMNSLPDYLIIELTRNQYDVKIGNYVKNTTDVFIPLNLEMKSYCENEIIDSSYDLIGVGIHEGGTGGGHYYAYIKDQFDVQQLWYECNDSRITFIADIDKTLRDKGKNITSCVYVKKSKVEEIKKRAKERQNKLKNAEKAVDSFAQALSSIAKG